MKNTSDSGSKYSPSVSSTFFSASTEQSDHKETPARQTYTVEAIRSHLPKKATRKTAKTYVVKWLGYPENENTKQDSAQLEKEVPDVIYWYWYKKDQAQKSTPVKKSSGRKNPWVKKFVENDRNQAEMSDNEEFDENISASSELEKYMKNQKEKMSQIEKLTKQNCDEFAQENISNFFKKIRKEVTKMENTVIDCCMNIETLLEVKENQFASKINDIRNVFDK